LAYKKKSSEGFTEVSMLAVSKGGGGFLSSGAGVVISPCVCATGLVSGGGLFSAGILPAVWTFGGGVAVANGGDFCGSVCARAVAAVSTPRRVRHVRFRIRHERREDCYCPTGSCPGRVPGAKDRAKTSESAIIIRTPRPLEDAIHSLLS